MLASIPYTDITREIIASAIEVHRVLGPGLLESVYFKCLQYELSYSNTAVRHRTSSAHHLQRTLTRL